METTDPDLLALRKASETCTKPVEIDPQEDLDVWHTNSLGEIDKERAAASAPLHVFMMGMTR